MDTKRVAILVTDIVGYSGLMSENIHKAMLVLEKNRQIHKASINKFNGKFIKEMGDGIVSIYQNCHDAVNSALEIRKNCCREASLKLRLGIHYGDVVVRYSDIAGLSLQIACHLEAAGSPGEIFLSERVYREIKDKIDVPIHFFSECRVKDHPKMIKIYKIPMEKAAQRSSSIADLHADMPVE